MLKECPYTASSLDALEYTPPSAVYGYSLEVLHDQRNFVLQLQHVLKLNIDFVGNVGGFLPT